MNAASLSPAKGRKIADYNVYGFVQRADHAGCGYIGAVCAISKWVEGSVVPEKEQIKIAVGEGFMRVPLVARARGRTIVVQFLLGRNLFVRTPFPIVIRQQMLIRRCSGDITRATKRGMLKGGDYCS
jgi:hypothetical protein